jgi:hypothetical protein
MFLPKLGDQVSHPYSTTGKITVLYILIFRFYIFEIIIYYYAQINPASP